MHLRTFLASLRPGLLMFALLAATITPQAFGGTAALDFTSPNTGYLDATNRMMGWQFTVNNAISVTDLGWVDYAQDGLVAAHQVGIWVDSTQSLLATATVQSGTSSPLTGYFRYEALISPLVLTPGTLYVIGGYDPGSSDAHVWDVFLSGYAGYEVNGFSVASDVTVGAAGTARGMAAGSFSFPSIQTGGTRTVLMGPNFLYDSAAVPEPGTIVFGGTALFGMLMLALRRRGTVTLG